MDGVTKRELELRTLARLMAQNPDRQGGDVEEDGTFKSPFGTTTRPQPAPPSLTEEAQEALKQKMRERSPSKVRVRQLAEDHMSTGSLTLSELRAKALRESFTLQRSKDVPSYLKDEQGVTIWEKA